MKDSRVFLLFWFINGLVFYLAPYVLVGQVVAGNARLGSLMACVISGFLLTVAVSLTLPIFNSFKIKFSKEWQMGLAYLFVNVLGIWVIARYADLTGFGIANAWIAVLLGILINLIQWGLWKYLKGKKMME